MLAIPDPEADLDNNESDAASSSNGVTTPCPKSSYSSKLQLSSTKSSTINYNLNVNYNHNHSILTKNGEALDVNILFKDFTQHTSIPIAGKLIKTSKERDDQINNHENYRIRTLHMNNMKQPLEYNYFDIPELPSVNYTSINLNELIHDWDDSSHLIIHNIPIPLKYWKKVYCYEKPDEWNGIKTNWCKWRVCDFFLRNLRCIVNSEISLLS